MADHRLQIILAAKDATGNVFKRLNSRVKGLAKSMFSLRGAAVALGGIGGIGYLVKSSLDAADAIGKTADAVGISTTTLQEYQHAAELSGVNTKKLNSVFLAFAKRVGELRQGTGPLVTFLNKFDQTLLKNIRSAKTTDAALNLVFKRMGQISSATDRAALANAAFSRSGIALTVMVKDGAAGLERMTKEAHTLGIVMGRDVIDSAAGANDALQKLSSTFKSSFTTAITANVDTLTAGIENLAGAMGKVAKYGGLGSILATGYKAVNLIASGEMKLPEGKKWDDFSFIEQQNLLNKFLEDRDTANLGSYEQARRQYQAPAGPADTGVQAAASGKQLKDNIKVITPLTDMWATFYDEQTRMASAASIKKAAVLQSYELPANTQTVVALTDMWATFNDEQTRAASAASIAKADALAGLADDAAGAASSIEDTFSEAFNSASYALTDFLLEGKSSFADFTNSVLNDLARIGLQKVIGGGLDSVFASFMHSGGVVGSGGTTRPVAPATFIGAPRLHKGLLPDEFPAILQRGETVIPKNKAGAGASANVEVFVNNYSNEPATVRESQGPGNLRQIFVMIGNDIKTGGPTANALEQTYNIRRSGRTV